jgi:hypothetical protein
MRLQFSPLGPAICVVVVTGVTQQQALVRSVNDQADIPVHADGGEVLVFGLFQLVELHSGAGRVDLQVKSGRLNRLLFVAGQLGEAVGKCVGDAEVHVPLMSVEYRIHDHTETLRRLCQAVNQ